MKVKGARKTVRIRVKAQKGDNLLATESFLKNPDYPFPMTLCFDLWEGEKDPRLALPLFLKFIIAYSMTMRIFGQGSRAQIGD